MPATRTICRASNANPRYVFVRGDICDEGAVRELLEQHAIDTIVHFAAESHVDRSILGPDDFIRTNVVGTHALLKAAKALWIDGKIVPPHRFHHVSTDEVYGSLGPNDAPFHESTPYAPNSPYSASKAASDHLVRAYHETYGLDTTVTNCSNNYGPYQFPEKLIPLTLINILQGKPLPVYGDGLQVRDWLHVADHCEAIALALTRGRPARSTTSAAMPRRPTSRWSGLCAPSPTRFWRPAPSCEPPSRRRPSPEGGRPRDLIEHVRDRPGHDRRYAIDYRKAAARDRLFADARSCERACARRCEWYLANRSWWEALLGRDYSAWMRRTTARM